MKTGVLKKSTLLLAMFACTSAASASSEDKAEKKTVINPEFEQAMQLTPNLKNGKQLYLSCVTCHGPEGWGTQSGSYPQIAGQLKSVVIKQLADFRAGNRDNPMMRAFASRNALGGPQEIADIAGYISNMPMTDQNGKGPSHRLDNGKVLYEKNCVDCHGKNGEGVAADLGPSLQGQHFNYLKRQFDWIRNGLRRNADRKMAKQIMNFSLRDEIDVLSYAATLRPPKEKLAPENWTNPDFPKFSRGGSFVNITNSKNPPAARRQINRKP